MAEQKRTKSRQPQRRRRPTRRPRPSLLARLKALLPAKAEFREDPEGKGLVKLLYVTRLQRLHYLRWGLYIVTCVMALVLQDVIMSRVKLFGATTDLAPAAILLVAVLEGSEVGSVFALVASVIYFFSGTAPGAYSVGLISVLGLLASLFRQKYMHRGTGSILLCACTAMALYELGVYLSALFLGLTYWSRFPRFALTALYTMVAMVPMYHLLHRIGLIGGNIWKE